MQSRKTKTKFFTEFHFIHLKKKEFTIYSCDLIFNFRIVLRSSYISLLYHLSFTESPPLSSPVEVQHHKQTIHLWQFLKDLLLRPDRYNSCIKWVDRQRGIFKIEDSSKVAKLWGLRKNRPAMNYDKLSRSIRQYYKKGIIKKTEHSKRLVYQFCQPYL